MRDVVRPVPGQREALVTTSVVFDTTTAHDISMFGLRDRLPLLQVAMTALRSTIVHALRMRAKLDVLALQR